MESAEKRVDWRKNSEIAPTIVEISGVLREKRRRPLWLNFFVQPFAHCVAPSKPRNGRVSGRGKRTNSDLRMTLTVGIPGVNSSENERNDDQSPSLRTVERSVSLVFSSLWDPTWRREPKARKLWGGWSPGKPPQHTKTMRDPVSVSFKRGSVYFNQGGSATFPWLRALVQC